MISNVISRLIIMLFGVLFPVYSSYKAIKNKDVKAHLHLMMYWITFGLFTCAETFLDIFVSFWMPFYYEVKILFVLWLLSPTTKGSSLLYRRFVHPQLVQREQEIDDLIEKAKEQGYSTLLLLGSRGLSYATSVVLQTAIKAQEAVVAYSTHASPALEHGKEQPDGTVIGSMDVDSDPEPLSLLSTSPTTNGRPAPPLMGTGDDLVIGSDLCSSNPGSHGEGLALKPHSALMVPRPSIKNRTRTTTRTADPSGPVRRSMRIGKGCSGKH